ncbi:hypothetical protein EPA93_15490 [Ktedonosporobacter rubrisoli]|uniref:Toll/interleukin-1 receptor domain-containing protein n=1 Tax=Ktedonosporobacter rubrisoli TaxID=2509675 RepID=A0A4P6JPK9_KTERU|nr:hypothetical protein [Ktedonosporobacter rubrisoli]QBD77317.1 hypothetical protein EPA93_15490 [Ktedonosporobacter rubrisoli]
MVNDRAIKVFYFCVPADELYCQRLEMNLVILKRHGAIQSWASNITTDPSNLIDELKTVDIVLFLISPDFLAADHNFRADFQIILEHQNDRRIYAVPLLVRPVYMEGSPFSYIESLPTGSKPIAKWKNEDEAWVNVSWGISKIASHLQAMRRYERSHPSLAPAPIDPFTVAAAGTAIAQVILMVSDMWSRRERKGEEHKQDEVKEVRVLTGSGQWVHFRSTEQAGGAWNQVQKVRALMSDNHWIELQTEDELQYRSSTTTPAKVRVRAVK